ncbi:MULTISPECIES: trans-aconitate 2-methyltransferase [unclassified Ensifer]|uniref:trans-aconitate 2-methyltransferase n=1 Tax=unclassified Ensifer TaxID=2633371 RepID=UPI00088DC587|nr:MULTISPECIES: trans-aconitate 2-methyltransferase [unclassified Ensifer]MBD9597458.1 trans-aconitate 2-methyltransferase [Ensifer sp. ENS05]SDN51533.1 trans-aconitate 2-methyltransferase [Ensifer sp. YR511]
MSATWSPSQYLKFEDHRTRPAIDLLARVVADTVEAATDIGCGPGNSTELLVDRFGSTAISGIDSSSKMVEAARKRLPDCEFELGDVAHWKPDATQDLLFANAVLQWVPNHDELFPKLLSFLKPGGTLALQMPDNLDQPTHAGMRTAARDERWSNELKDADGERTSILSPSDYWCILKPHASSIDIWRTTYNHPLKGLSGIVEWFKGTGLLPYLSRLSEAKQTEYLATYEELLSQHYPVMDDGTVLLPFPRLFIIARR